MAALPHRGDVGAEITGIRNPLFMIQEQILTIGERGLPPGVARDEGGVLVEIVGGKLVPLAMMAIDDEWLVESWRNVVCLFTWEEAEACIESMTESHRPLTAYRISPISLTGKLDELIAGRSLMPTGTMQKRGHLGPMNLDPIVGESETEASDPEESYRDLPAEVSP